MSHNTLSAILGRDLLFLHVYCDSYKGSLFIGFNT